MMDLLPNQSLEATGRSALGLPLRRPVRGGGVPENATFRQQSSVLRD
jgi:hypothetical protein